jgi:hypothetical protein
MCRVPCRPRRRLFEGRGYTDGDQKRLARDQGDGAGSTVEEDSTYDRQRAAVEDIDCVGETVADVAILAGGVEDDVADVTEVADGSGDRAGFDVDNLDLVLVGDVETAGDRVEGEIVPGALAADYPFVADGVGMAADLTDHGDGRLLGGGDGADEECKREERTHPGTTPGRDSNAAVRVDEAGWKRAQEIRLVKLSRCS